MAHQLSEPNKPGVDVDMPTINQMPTLHMACVISICATWTAHEHLAGYSARALMPLHAGRNTYARNRVLITHSTGLSKPYPLCPEDMHRASQARKESSRVTWVTG